MILGLYSIYDKVSGLHSEPFTSVNDNVAKRRFAQICAGSQNMAGDLELYKLGDFDSSRGLVAGYEQASFICGGVEANG